MSELNHTALEIFKALIVDPTTYSEWLSKSDRYRFPGSYFPGCPEYISHVADLAIKSAEIFIDKLKVSS